MRRALVVLILSAATASAAPAKHVVTAPTAKQLASFKSHLKAAYALQKQKKWAQAVTELEAALALVDADPRALAELGFSAMNAGDFVKARRADEQAVQVAVDKPVKAAALYNLGLVAQRSGDDAGALKAWRASLELRPNATVAKAVAALGTAAKAEAPFCAPGAKPCDCVLAATFGPTIPDDPSTGPCTASPDKPPVPGFHIFHVERDFHSEHYDYLLDEHDQLVAVIGGGFEYRYGAVSNDVKLDKAEVTTIGGHQVLRVQTTETTWETSSSSPDATVTMTKTTAVTLCVLGKPATRCPLRAVPIAATTSDDGKESSTVLDLAIAPTGVATLKLVKGPSDAQIDALVGPHPLW